MSPLSKTPPWSGTFPSKLDIIKSFRRRTSKSEREPAPIDPEEYVPCPTRISSLTAESVTSVPHPADSPSPSPPRRVRMSGSRLPSGYRPNVSPILAPKPVANPPIHPQPQPSLPHQAPSPPLRPLRKRITRLIPGHTARAALVSTPTSSTLSFPSSSRASTSTAASAPKTVRFSPSTSLVRATQQRNQGQHKVEESEKPSRWGRKTSMTQGRDGAADRQR